MPCTDQEGKIAISQTKFVKARDEEKKFFSCPFAQICKEYGHMSLLPPKSISIRGRTGWTEAYTTKGNGGGGLMA